MTAPDISPCSAAIHGIGVVSASGCGIEALLDALRRDRPPTPGVMEVALPGGAVRIPVYRAAVDGLERRVDRRALRRIDPFARMALLAALLAVEDAGVPMPDPARVGIVFASGYGPQRTTFAFQDSVIDFGDRCASPTHFANSVHNVLATQVSISMGIRGPTQTLTCFGSSAAAALSMGAGWIAEGLADWVLVGAGEEISDLQGYAVASRRGGCADEGGVRPFDWTACTHAPGEGFAAFLLGPSRDPGPYGVLESVEFGAGLAVPPAGFGDLDALFLAAQGNMGEAEGYRAASGWAPRCRAHAPFYGSMPVGDAFELAVSALALREGSLFDPRDVSRVSPLQRIGVYSHTVDGFSSRLTVRKAG